MKKYNGIIIETSFDNKDKGVPKYSELLLEYIKTNTPSKVQQNALSKVFTLMTMNYQICDGGVKQYYDNGYNLGKKLPNYQIFHKEKIVTLYKKELIPLVESIYGKNTLVSNILKNLAVTWSCVYLQPSETYKGGDTKFSLVNDDSFERILYHFYEYDTLLEMYAEYMYKKYFI